MIVFLFTLEDDELLSSYSIFRKSNRSPLPFHRLNILLIFDLFIIMHLLLLPIMLLQIYFLSILPFITFNFSSHELFLFRSFIIIIHLPLVSFRQQRVISFIFYCCDFKDTKIHYRHYLHFLLTPLHVNQSNTCLFFCRLRFF